MTDGNVYDGQTVNYLIFFIQDVNIISILISLQVNFSIFLSKLHLGFKIPLHEFIAGGLS